MTRKWCRKCATDTPHPFAHWHVWCRYCRSVRVYRGACCKACHASARALLSDVLDAL